jgi:predicted GTPase
MPLRTLILGAAGRDFHNFNVLYRNCRRTDVVGFTATQIPEIADKTYPAELAGERYPDGIPIYPEHSVEQVMFAYSDVSHEHVMHLASRTLAAGADFVMCGPERTALQSKLPVVAVCAVRTGCGKSPVSRAVVKTLVDSGKRVAVIRHPMPYGELSKQRVQRFDKLEDLDTAECTIEEREEYEPHIMEGTVVFAGADYELILAEAEKESDVIIWDGGNNDLPFIRPSLHLTLVDPHRAGHETMFHPGEANFYAADVLVMTKVGNAPEEGLEALRETIANLRPGVPVVEGDLEISFDVDMDLTDKKVLCVEDGPTTTHGGMNYGSAVWAARRANAHVVDPRPAAVGSVAETFNEHPHLTNCLPAMGYYGQQLADLETSIKNAECDAVVIGTPIDLRRIVEIAQPSVRALYNWKDRGQTPLANHVLAAIEGAEVAG